MRWKWKKNTEEIAIPPKMKMDNSLADAERAATIVQTGAEKQDIKGILNGLQELPIDNSKNNVFPADGVVLRKAIIVFAVLAVLAFLRIVFYAVGTIILSTDYRLIGVLLFVVSVACVTYSIWTIKKQLSYVRFVGRYNQYEELLKYKNTEIIDDLGSYVKIPSETVCQDLKEAINLKLIPEGHFGTDNRIILLSDAIYQKYKENQDNYDYYYKKIWEEHRRIEERSPFVASLLEEGEKYVSNIRTSNHLIKDREITRQLNHMEKTVRAIFYEVDMDSSQTEKIGTLLYIYLPTIEKLLDTYVEIDAKKVDVPNSRKAKSEIAESLKMFNEAFDGILNQFYEEKELDIASDIASIRSLERQKDDS